MSENVFVALDVETANPDYASICQIGIVKFNDGKVSRIWESLVNPEDVFYPPQVAIHGINHVMVKEAPTLPKIWDGLQEILADQVVVTHTAYDRVALRRAAAKYDLTQVTCTWLDTARVTRRAWSQFAQRGYALDNVTAFLGIEFDHHNAKEDARAAGEVLLKAIEETGLSVNEWLTRVEERVDGRTYSTNITREGNLEGPLHGEVLVFTGALSISRRKAADLAADAGCRVASGVSRKVTTLVVGEQDLRLLAGHKKSSKHRKAEKLIKEGYPIRIIGEEDFRLLIEA